MIVNQVKELEKEKGFDAQAEKFVDMVKAGIIDPTKAVRTALQNAGSISGLMLTTEALINEIPEENAGAAAPGCPRRPRWRRHARIWAAWAAWAASKLAAQQSNASRPR